MPERERAPLTAWWSREFWENRLFWCRYYLQRTEDAALARRFEMLAEQAADNLRLLPRRDRRAARAEQVTGAVGEGVQHLKASEEREPLPDPERLGCYGRYGYGTGWGLPFGQHHCSTCPARDLCANILLGRAEESFLDAGQAQDQFAAQVARNVGAGYLARRDNSRYMPDKGKGR